jgi:hypothetical protein
VYSSLEEASPLLAGLPSRLLQPEHERPLPPRPARLLQLAAGVTLEALMRHFIDDCDLKALADSWRATLSATEAAFDEIQKKRLR